MSRFTGIPNLPQQGVDEWQVRVLGAMKQNIELLIGARGEADASSRAVLRSSVKLSGAPQPSLRSISAVGSGFTISGAQVPSLADYQNLVRDMQLLANDMQQLRTALNQLIAQLRN